MYFGAGDGTAFELPSQLRNVKWATWTCRLGWPVQGAWSKSAGEAADGEGGTVEPATVDRSSAATSSLRGTLTGASRCSSTRAW